MALHCDRHIVDMFVGLFNCMCLHRLLLFTLSTWHCLPAASDGGIVQKIIFPLHNSIMGSICNQSKKMLITINMFSFQHWDSLDDIFSNYRDICEAGWYLEIVMLTTAFWDTRVIIWTKRNLFCYRINASVPLELKIYDESIGRRIVDYSRIPTMENLDKFDVFAYAEGDMFLSLALLEAWMAESRKLKLLTTGKRIMDLDRCGWRYPCRYSIGFIRFWRKLLYSPKDRSNLREYRRSRAQGLAEVIAINSTKSLLYPSGGKSGTSGMYTAYCILSFFMGYETAGFVR